MTVTLIWPGYVSVSSIWRTMSRASRHRRQVVDLVGPHQDAHLASGLHGERLLDARERVCDGLQVREALQVRVHGLATGTRS